MSTFYERFVKDMFLDEAGNAQGCPVLDASEEELDYIGNFGMTHAAMGLAGEAGEVVDVIKKHVFTGKRLDREELIKELGDVEFYLEALRQQVSISREDVLLANWEKLSQRHSDNETIRDYYDEKQ